MKISNEGLLWASLALVAGIIAFTSVVKASPLHKAQVVPETWSTGKFQRNKGLHNNGLCRARWLLPFTYSKDVKQRKILRKRFQDCLKRETKKRKHINRLRKRK